MHLDLLHSEIPMAVGTWEGEKSLPPPLTIGLLALSCEHDVPLPYIQLSGRFPFLTATAPDGVMGRDSCWRVSVAMAFLPFQASACHVHNTRNQHDGDIKRRTR